MRAERERLVESGHLFAEGRRQARVDRRAVERVERRRVIGAGPKIERPCMRDVTFRERRVGFGADAARCRNPCVVIRAVVAVADGIGYGPDFAKLRPAIGNVGDGPGAEVFVQVVVEKTGNG